MFEGNGPETWPEPSASAFTQARMLRPPSPSMSESCLSNRWAACPGYRTRSHAPTIGRSPRGGVGKGVTLPKSERDAAVLEGGRLRPRPAPGDYRGRGTDGLRTRTKSSASTVQASRAPTA